MKKFKDLLEAKHINKDELDIGDDEHVPTTGYKQEGRFDLDKYEKSFNAVSERLHNKHLSKLTDDDRHHLEHYSGASETKVNNSATLNKKLIAGEKLDEHEQKMHQAIHNNAHPAGEDLHLYSGISPDFGEKFKKAKSGTITHSPAHISTTLKSTMAVRFSGDHAARSSSPHHIIHVHAKPDDKVLHIGKISKHQGECETVIPSGTKLKYSHTTKHMDMYTPNIYVHHVTIEK